MSTVKISELVLLPSISANTSNTIFLGVDLPTNITGRFTATTLAQQLYANNILNVGNNIVNLPNTIAQFSLSGESYIQTNLVNLNDGGTADIVVTANAGSGGTDAANFIDMGWANKNYQAGSEFNNIGNAVRPNDGYLYAQGTSGNNYGNLVIGTTSTNANLKFIVGGGSAQNIVARMTTTGLVLNTQSSITFSDGTVQSTAAIGNNYTQASYALANTNAADIVLIKATNAIQNANISTVVTQSQAAFAKANAALANATGTFAGDLTITGNVSASSSNSGGVVIANNAIYSSLTGQDLIIGQTGATANLVVNRITNFVKDINATGNITAAGIQSTTGAITTGNLIVSGTANVSGTLNVVGVISGNAQVVLQNTNFSATQSALTISASPTVATPSNDGYMIHISGKQNVSSRIVTDSYGANTYVVYAGRSARGNVSNPSGVKAGDVLTRFSGNGFGATGFSPLGSGRLDIVATEDFTDTARGTQLQLWNTAAGTNTLTQIASFNGVSVTFLGEVNPQKGLVLTPNVLSGITTTLNIDIANNSLYKFVTNATTTINLSGFKAGKIVEVWIQNSDTGAGSNHTITHGCLANNSTVGATSFTLTSLHAAYIRYFSIDGDLANTFCHISYS